MSDVLIKASKVILSCETEGQLKVAVKYAALAAENLRGSVVDINGKVVIPFERIIAVKRYQLGCYDDSIKSIMSSK